MATKRTIRNRANEKLGEILCDQGHKCYYCKRPLVWLRYLLQNKIEIVRQTANTVSYVKNGVIVQENIATVDHKIRIVDTKPGDHPNNRKNLVAACLACNNGRNDQLLFETPKRKFHGWRKLPKNRKKAWKEKPNYQKSD